MSHTQLTTPHSVKLGKDYDGYETRAACNSTNMMCVDKFAPNVIEHTGSKLFLQSVWDLDSA